MRMFRLTLAAGTAFACAAVAAAQDIPVLVEDAAQAGWAYGDNGNLTTPQTLSEEQHCGMSWYNLDKAYDEGVFDADLVEAMPDQLKPAAAKEELAAWAERLKPEFADPIATFRDEDAGRFLTQARTKSGISKAASGDPTAMFKLAWNFRGCQISLME